MSVALRYSIYLVLALIPTFLDTSNVAWADDCIEALPAEYLSPACPTSPTVPGTLGSRSSMPEIEEQFDAAAERLRSEFGIPSPPDHWRTGARRQDLTNVRDGRSRYVAALIAERLAGNERVTETVDTQLRALSEADRHFDPALTMAKAYWESGGTWLQANASPIDTFGQGGMDNFGAPSHFNTYESSVPCGYGRHWLGHNDGIASRTNYETNPPTEVYPAEIPANELLTAYGVRLKAARTSAREAINTQFGGDTFAGLSRRTRRFMTLIAFAAPGGYEYKREGHGDDPPAKGLGINTLAAWLKARIEDGMLRSLNDAPFDVAMRPFHRVRSAIVVSAIAEMVDQTLLKPATSSDCCINGTWRMNIQDLAKKVGMNTTYSGEAVMNIPGDDSISIKYTNFVSSVNDKPLSKSEGVSRGTIRASGLIRGNVVVEWTEPDVKETNLMLKRMGSPNHTKIERGEQAPVGHEGVSCEADRLSLGGVPFDRIGPPLADGF